LVAVHPGGDCVLAGYVQNSTLYFLSYVKSHPKVVPGIDSALVVLKGAICDPDCSGLAQITTVEVFITNPLA
jgi:hypothetical protein